MYLNGNGSPWAPTGHSQSRLLIAKHNRLHCFAHSSWVGILQVERFHKCSLMKHLCVVIADISVVIRQLSSNYYHMQQLHVQDSENQSFYSAGYVCVFAHVHRHPVPPRSMWLGGRMSWRDFHTLDWGGGLTSDVTGLLTPMISVFLGMSRWSSHPR